MKLTPFTGVRVAPQFLSNVAAESYDSISPDLLTRIEILSFLHVSHVSESQEQYERAREKFFSLIRERVFLAESEPALYIYEIQCGVHCQSAVVGLVSVKDFSEKVIHPHEKTLLSKEAERITHLLEVGVDSGPVMLMYREKKEIQEAVAIEKRTPPLYQFEAAPGETHRLWRVKKFDTLSTLFEKVPSACIADGHHRSAAAQAVMRRSSSAASKLLLAALFPHSELKIDSINRLLAIPVAEKTLTFFTRRSGYSTPEYQDVLLYVSGNWYSYAQTNNTAGIKLYSEKIANSLFGIRDERNDPRVAFGIAKGRELAQKVDQREFECAVEFAPLRVLDVMNMAEAGVLAPPKATYFYPKVRSGILVHHHHATLAGHKF